MANNNELIMETLIRGVQETRECIKTVQEQVNESKIALKEIDTTLKYVIKSVDDLCLEMSSFVRGKDSIVNKVIVLENNVEKFREFIKENKEIGRESSAKLAAITTAQMAVVTTDVQGKWQMRVALITGSFATLASVITLAITFLK